MQFPTVLYQIRHCIGCWAGDPFSLLLNLFSASLPPFEASLCFYAYSFQHYKFTSVLPKVSYHYHGFGSWLSVPHHCVAHTCTHVSRWPLHPPRVQHRPPPYSKRAMQPCSLRYWLSFLFASRSLVLIFSSNNSCCVKKDLVVRVGENKILILFVFHWLIWVGL